jgi:thiosulfate dehydrogenase [quinone] large subunit
MAGVVGVVSADSDAGAATKGKRIGPASQVPVGESAAFTDPTTKNPSLVIQLHKGSFVAYDAVCPHQGCTVGYAPSQKLIMCPCHGSEFNPSNGHLVRGPAPHGLKRLTVSVVGGQLFVKG